MRRSSSEWSERDDSSPDPIDLLSPEKPIPHPAPVSVPPRRPPPLQSRGSPRTWPESPVTAGPSSYRHHNQNQNSHSASNRQYSPKKRTPRVILSPSPSRSAPSSPSDEDAEEQVRVALSRNNHKRRRVLSNSDNDEDNGNDRDSSRDNQSRPTVIDIKGREASRAMVSRSRSPRKGPADSSAIPEESEQEQDSPSSSPRQHDGDMTVQMDVQQSGTPPRMPSPPDTSIAPISDVPTGPPLVLEPEPPLNVEPAATLGPIDAADAADLPASLDLRDIASPPAGQFGSDDPPSSPVHLEVAMSAEAKTDEGDAPEGHGREEASPPAQETDESAQSAETGLAPQEAFVDTQLADDNVDTPDQMDVGMPTSETIPQPAETPDTSLAPNPDGVGLQEADPAPQTTADIPVAEQSRDHTDTELPLPEEAAQTSIAEDSTPVVQPRSPPVVTDAIQPMDVDMAAEVVADAVQGGLHASTQEGDPVPGEAEHNEADLAVVSTSASVAAEAEGEEELDDAMDVDEKTEDVIAATPSAPVAPDSAPDEPIVAEVGTPSTKNAPKSKSKSKSKAAGRSEVEKPASKKAATKEKPKSDKKGGQGSKAKTKVDDLKSSSKPRSASASESAHPASASVASQEIPAHREESVDPDDTAVYCVCRKPYSEEDEGEVMVACDACDNWYHPTCVGLSEDQLELVETYICKSCEGSTAQRTVYKTSCKREDCDNSVAGKASKFCSSACAFKHSMDIVAAISNKRSVKQLTATLSSYPAPVLGVQVINHLPTPPASPNRLASSSSSALSRKDKAAEALLESLQKQIGATMAAIELVQRRQAILVEVTARAAMLASATPQVHGDDASGGGSKKSRKGGGGGVDMGPCGWEPKLVWDDDEVRAWIGGTTHQGQLNGSGDDREGQEHNAEQAQPNGDGQDGAGQPELPPAESVVDETQACLKNKRRCDRHSGWQKTVNAALELEERTLERRLQGLQDERDGVSRNLELDKAAQATRSLVGEKLQRKVVG